MIISARPLYLVAGLAAALLAGGCATTYWLSVNPTPPKIQERVHPGDRVIITTKANEHYTLEVTQVTWEAVIGTSTVEMEKEITVPFGQIASRTRSNSQAAAGGERSAGFGRRSCVTRGARVCSMKRRPSPWPFT